MIAYIKGTLAQLLPTQAIIETQGGVAYQLHISLHTHTQIQHYVGKVTQILTYLHLSENNQVLYGFAENTEKQLFIQLISVSGIGPNTAQVMLSSLHPQEIKQALAQGNTSLIQSIKGIGAKTAARAVLELKEKMAKEVQGANNELVTPESDYNNAYPEHYRNDALNALAALGIGKTDAQKAINRVLKSGEAIDTVETLIKKALKAI